MDQIFSDFSDKDVLFYTLYTAEPHPGQTYDDFDFTDVEQTGTEKQRAEYAEIMRIQTKQKRPILIDIIGDDCIQNTLGRGLPNSAFIIDKDKKMVL